MDPSKKRVPILQFDTNVKRTAGAMIPVVTVFLIGPLPHCVPVERLDGVYACEPDIRHHPHIDRENVLESSTSNGTVLVTNTMSSSSAMVPIGPRFPMA
jgi:hypothetical protein